MKKTKIVGINEVALTLKSGKLIVSNAYQAYTLVKEQLESQNIPYEQSELAQCIQNVWPELFATLE